MARKKVSETRKQIQEIYEQNELASLKESQTRARSFLVGTTTGGIIEVCLRGDFTSLWYTLHPVEAVEMIESLAAAAGLQVALRPKQDFSTWRSWDTTTPGCAHWVGAAAWQLDDEQREYLTSLKEKNMSAIYGENLEQKKLNEKKDKIENESE